MILKTKRGGFAEIYADGLRFSLLKRVGEEEYHSYHGSTCCKDFFTDIFWSERMKEQTNIHGFGWRPGTIALDEPYYFMSMEHSSDLSGKAALMQDFLQEFDRAFGFPPTQVKAAGKALVVAFANEWTQRPALISMVTGLMRISLTYKGRSPAGGIDFESFFDDLLKNGNPFGDYDQSEFRKDGVVPLILSSMENGCPPHAAQTFEQYTSPYQCHHSGGFIAYTTGRATG